MAKDWMDDKITAKFINLQRPGDDIYIGCQGVGYQIKDGATVTVPRLVLEAAKDAVQTRYKVSGDMNKGKTASPYQQARFMVVPLDQPMEKTKEEKKKTELLKDLKNDLKEIDEDEE